MPDPTDRDRLEASWLRFTDSVRVLIVPRADDRPLDQFLSFRDAVFKLVQSRRFLDDLRDAWTPFTDSPLMDVGEVLLFELEAFPLAVEVAEATEKQVPEGKGWREKVLGKASTVAGSVKDILENLPPFAKHALTLFRELLDLFKGKD